MVETASDQSSPALPLRFATGARRLAAVGLAVAALLATIVMGAGWWVRGRVESTVAQRIVQQLPGSDPAVAISSFPFLVRLAASGTISEMSAHLSRVSAGPFSYNGVHVAAATFDDVDIRVTGLRLRRADLVQRKVVIAGIRAATVTATLLQDSLDKSVGLPITLGQGTVGLGGLSLPAQIGVSSRQATVSIPGQLSFSLALPPLDVFPCHGRVLIQPGALRVSCRMDRLPPVLSATTFTF